MNLPLSPSLVSLYALSKKGGGLVGGDAAAYKRLLEERGDERVRLGRLDEMEQRRLDAEKRAHDYEQQIMRPTKPGEWRPMAPAPEMANVASQGYNDAVNRGAENAATGVAGWNRSWTPFFEALTTIGDLEGKRVHTNVHSMDLPFSPAPPAPMPQGPAALEGLELAAGRGSSRRQIAYGDEGEGEWSGGLKKSQPARGRRGLHPLSARNSNIVTGTGY